MVYIKNLKISKNVYFSIIYFITSKLGCCHGYFKDIIKSWYLTYLWKINIQYFGFSQCCQSIMCYPYCWYVRNILFWRKKNTPFYTVYQMFNNMRQSVYVNYHFFSIFSKCFLYISTWSFLYLSILSDISMIPIYFVSAGQMR